METLYIPCDPFFSSGWTPHLYAPGYNRARVIQNYPLWSADISCTILILTVPRVSANGWPHCIEPAIYHMIGACCGNNSWTAPLMFYSRPPSYATHNAVQCNTGNTPGSPAVQRQWLSLTEALVSLQLLCPCGHGRPSVPATAALWEHSGTLHGNL